MGVPDDIEKRLNLARSNNEGSRRNPAQNQRMVDTMRSADDIGPWGQGYPAPTTGVPDPPVGRGGGPAYGQTPFGGYENQQDLSPTEAEQLQQAIDKGVSARLKQARSIAPSIRQQSQAELINLTLAYEQLGNPFSQRRIPFSVLRDMATDPMIFFAWYYTTVPLVRANWRIEGPDAQINAAVDFALRQVNPSLQVQLNNKLLYGYQPFCKKFKLGRIDGYYRDPQSEDPLKDVPIWDSNVDALLWGRAHVLAPEHVMPRWNERGDFDGFYFSIVPLPNPIQIGLANLYGYAVVPGFEITSEFAMWATNELSTSFGSLYGSPRTVRAYRSWWSYWYLWAISDRAFENNADPPKRVYYPADIDEVIDPNDPNIATSPQVKHMQNVALALGERARSGATLAIPGGFVRGEDGKLTNQREWDIDFLKPTADFGAIASRLSYLDSAKFRSMLVPEQAFIEGGSSSSGSKGGTSRLMGIQLGEVYQEAQQLLADENDEVINDDMIPQFIAANFPEKAGTPCRKVTDGFGAYDVEIMKQIIQLYGQVTGNLLPVDIRSLMSQAGLPLLSQKEYDATLNQIAKQAEKMQPQPVQPTSRGMEGYNAGIEKTASGMSIYVQPPGRIDLDAYHHGAQGSFLGNLPDVPAYKDASVRASAMRFRKLMIERYQSQIDSFVESLRARNSIHLAQQAQGQRGQTSQSSAAASGTTTPTAGAAAPVSGLPPAQAAGIASGVVGAWRAATASKVAQVAIAGILLAVALRAVKRELKASNLAADVDEAAIKEWADERASEILDSVDQTLDQELSDFLAHELEEGKHTDEIADDAEARFADTAETHADRVVRSEVLPAYNRGHLLALQAAGVSQVQARDASDGTDTETDRICQERQGRTYSIEEALEVKDHPNGTLAWVALSTDAFKVVRGTIPGELNGKPGQVAAYHEDSETLFLSPDVSDEQEREFLLSVGEVLRLR